MMEMKFNSQVCTDKVQSERLLALGLKKETADMFWWDNGYGSCAVISRPAEKEDGEYGKVIPAWSLHRLIELIWGEGEHDMSLETHRPFEDCIERIDYMINQSCCFNKEYLV